MNIKIVEKKTNKLLDRTEVHFIVTADAETPKRLDVKSKLAAMINHDENLVVIKGLFQNTGSKTSKGIAHVYKSKETMERLEPEHLLKRNMPKAEEKQ